MSDIFGCCYVRCVVDLSRLELAAILSHHPLILATFVFRTNVVKPAITEFNFGVYIVFAEFRLHIVLLASTTTNSSIPYT